jgi:hypothetical protein
MLGPFEAVLKKQIKKKPNKQKKTFNENSFGKVKKLSTFQQNHFLKI